MEIRISKRRKGKTMILESEAYNLKSQAMLEFLMSYGWAIMVALIAVGALSYFGILSPDEFVPRRCALEPGIGCMDFKINENSVNLALMNGRGEDIVIEGIKVRNCTGTATGLLRNGEEGTFIVDGCSNKANKKFIGEVNISFTGETGLTHKNRGNIVGKVEAGSYDAGGGDGGDGGEGEGKDSGSDGPLDEITSQLTANINDSLPDDWHGAEGDEDNIVLKLFNKESYDIYLKNFTLGWNHSTNKFKHFQHLTEANGWSKIKIYEDNSFSPVNGIFDGKGNPYANLRIPANEYTIIDDLHFGNDIRFPTDFNLTLGFNDSTSSTLRFIIG